MTVSINNLSDTMASLFYGNVSRPSSSELAQLHSTFEGEWAQLSVGDATANVLDDAITLRETKNLNLTYYNLPETMDLVKLMRELNHVSEHAEHVPYISDIFYALTALVEDTSWRTEDAMTEYRAGNIVWTMTSEPGQHVVVTTATYTDEGNNVAYSVRYVFFSQANSLIDCTIRRL